MKRAATFWVFLAFYTTIVKADVPIHSDIALPQPEFADTDLGSPRNPPYRLNPMLWAIPTGVLLVLGAMVIIRRRNEAHSET